MDPFVDKASAIGLCVFVQTTPVAILPQAELQLFGFGLFSKLQFARICISVFAPALSIAMARVWMPLEGVGSFFSFTPPRHAVPPCIRSEDRDRILAATSINPACRVQKSGI